MIRIAFDIGGVLSKYPDVFRPLFLALVDSPNIEVYIISDMKPREKAIAFCNDNGFCCAAERIVCANYDAHGEHCKEVLCAHLQIDILIDDHMGYLMSPGNPLVRLFLMPDPTRDYYHATWQTDGSEDTFGRQHQSTDK